MRSTVDAIEGLSKGMALAFCPSVSGPSNLRAFDLSGNQRHGSFNSMDPGACWITRSDGNIIAFDGSNDSVQFPSSAGLQITGAITVSFWALVNNTGSFITFVTKGDSSVNEFEVSADFRSGNTILAWRPGSLTNFNNFFSGYTGRMVHVAVTCDGPGSGATISAYRNGLFFGSVAANAARTTTSNTVNLGLRSGLVNPGQFQLDDLRIYPRLLNPIEIGLLATQRGIGLRLWERSRRRSRVVPASGVNLTPNGITAGAPVLGTPALTQNHSITATAPNVAAPVTGKPVLSQNHVVAITPPSVAAPTTGTPGVSQNHSLTATAPSVAASTLGTPMLSLAGQLTPNGIAAGAPVLGTPSLTQNHSITITAPAVAAPTLGTPGLTQNHAIVATAPAIAAPTLGSPVLTLAGGSVSLTPRGITAGSPTLGSPSVTIAGSLTSSDYAFLLLLDVEGKDVTYVNPNGSTSTFKGIVHKASHVKNSEDWGFEEFTTRDVSFMATDDRGRANVMQYAEIRIDGEKFQIERYIRNANRWRCTLKRVEVNEVGRPHRRGRQ